MPTRTYTLTPPQVEAIRIALPELPPGNSGKFNPPDHPEVELGYEYDGASKLTVTILDDAWYETAGEIFRKLDTYMPLGSLPTTTA